MEPSSVVIEIGAVALVIGALVGLILGLTGAGGSLFAVPLLILGLGVSASQATGLALAAVAASALWGVIVRLPRGEVVWLPAIVLAISGAVMAPLGRWLAAMVPETLLLVGFAILVVFVAMRMWRQSTQAPESAKVTRASQGQRVSEKEAALCRFSPSGQLELKPRCLLGVVLGGVGAGILSGLFGVGGGFVIVPLLVLLTGLSISAAVATSLAVIAVISSAGFASFLYFGDGIDYALLAWLIIGGVLGMLLGSLVASRLAGPSLQKGFVIAMLSLTAATLAGQL
ncbi:sulfite exporter TauE/SafE family protein [Simiduia litorea]